MTKNSALTWSDLSGMGWLYDVPAVPYDAAYWERYREMDQTVMGVALTAERIALVQRYHTGQVVDVGIGGGGFLTAHGDCFGIDVNPDAIAWMKETGTLHDDEEPISAITFWDSAEHMTCPELDTLLNRVEQWAFISMPIYRDRQDCLTSKHFKPGEHLLYFTHNGLIGFMQRQGFALVEWNDMETKLGRESILSYAFVRTRWV